MKKIILTVAAVFALSFANAQDKKEGSEGFSKGDVFATGTLSLSSAKYTESGNYKEDGFTFSPSVGYFVTENIALGLGLNISNSSVQATEASDKSKINTFGVEAMGRYYFTPSSKFSAFGQVGLAYSTTKYDAADVKVNGFGIAAGPGFNYWISNNFALESSWGALTYASAKADTTGAETSTKFDLNVDLANIKFGLLYKF